MSVPADEGPAKEPGSPDRLRVTGREAELAKLDAFLAAHELGAVGLVITGDAGIGKSTLLRAAAGHARNRGVRCLVTSPTERERDLPWVAVQDLLSSVPEPAFERLAEPQRHALDAVLLRRPPPPGGIDPRTVATALLNVLRQLAIEQPLVLVIDDLHWVDVASLDALAFALRRIEPAPARLLLGERAAESDASPSSVLGIPVTRIVLGPLGRDAIGAILRHELGHPFARPELNRITDWAGGNPLLALEIGRRLLSDLGSRPGWGEDAGPGVGLPVLPAVTTLVGRRLHQQPARARRALLVIALAGRIDEAQLDATASRLGLIVRLPPSADGVVTRSPSGELRLAHPLLASQLIADATASDRQAVSAALAAVVEDPVVAARHLALATSAPDADVATRIARAADIAEGRGAPDVALELRELAAWRTPRERQAELQVRHLALGRLAARLGDPFRAELALLAAADGPVVRESVRALSALLELRSRAPSPGTAQIERRARSLAAGDHGLLAEVALVLPGSPRQAHRRARAAARLARHAGLDLLAAAAAGREAAIAFQLGIPFSVASLDAAVAAEDVAPPASIAGGSAHLRAWVRFFEDDYARSRAEYEELWRRAELLGDEASVSAILRELAHLEIRAGRWDETVRLTRIAMEAAERSRQPIEQAMCHLLLGAVASLRGDREIAEAELAMARDLGDDHGRAFVGGLAAGRLGSMYLSFNRLDAAREAFERSAARLAAGEWLDPALTNWRGDDAQVLVLLGRVDEAEELLDGLEASIGSLRRPVSAATVERGRAIVAAARGDLERAAAWAGRSVEHLRALEDPFQLARSLHVGGSIARRARRKALAAKMLEESASIFAGLGARAWETQVRAELGRIGLRPRAPLDLTVTEQLVARLASEGLTNREVADRAFISPRTVESVLSRVYAKLQVGSRAELGREMAGRSRVD